MEAAEKKILPNSGSAEKKIKGFCEEIMRLFAHLSYFFLIEIVEHKISHFPDIAIIVL